MHRPTIETNLAHTVLHRARYDPDRIALIFEDEKRSYRHFGLSVMRQASLLQTLGVCVGDRVGFIGFNQPVFLETLFAANAIGAVFVPLNFRLTATELTYIINDAGIHTLICDDEMQAVVDPVRDELCCQCYFGVINTLINWRSLHKECEGSGPLKKAVSVQPHDTSVIMYTSGTTGLPKGAMLSHGNLMWNNFNCLIGFNTSRNDVSLMAAPLFHIGGLNVVTLLSFMQGATLVLLRNFDAGQVLQAFDKYKVTVMYGAPAMFLFMSQHELFETTDFSRVNYFVCGGAAAPESLLKLYTGRGVSFCQGYGSTETAPFSSLLTASWSMRKIGSSGQAPMYTDLKIIDINGKVLPAGDKGEICVRGPNIMQGYWNNPAATAKAIDGEGWYHSGDIGYLDDEGFLYICDRLTDMVISGGENVYPAEVESVLAGHEAIAEVAVLGTPHDKWGEAVTAVVALHPGYELSLDDLRSFADGQLARYKLPLRLHQINQLPRNPAGKVLKFVIKERLNSAPKI